MPDMDELKGKAHEGMGSAKETAGRVSGDRETEAKGSAEKTEGKAEGLLGKAKDAAGDAAQGVKDKLGG